MESTVSHSDPLENRPRHRTVRFRLTAQPIADRIDRAVCHRLLLLYRSQSDFFVLGATGNVYTVSLSTNPLCTCPDRTTPCKHILFVLIRVLGVPVDDPCLQRRTLRPCKVDRLLATPSSSAAIASTALSKRFHEHFFRREKRAEPPPEVNMEDDAACPICLEEMGKGGERGRVVACTTCRNAVHEECLLRWKKSRGKKTAICVMCRARWRREREHDRYVNLAAYASEDDKFRDRAEDGGSLCGG